MRVTNTMMTNNAMINMAKNKEDYNKYFQEYSTQKKIQKPSDDPIIAVRSLKYRTRIAELEQYLYKNIPDATQWTDSTESVLHTINSKLTDMFDYCEQAANGTLTTSDRATIKEALKEFVGDIFEQNANSDYAGRYLFTGYRTDVPLLFNSASSDLTYKITENFNCGDINSFSYVYGGAEYAAGLTAGTYAANAPEYLSTHIMTLSYDKLDNDSTNPVTITYKDASGVYQTITPTPMPIKDDLKYNDHYKPGANDVYFVPETGELVFGDAIYAQISESQDIKVDYQKTNFEKNDIRPEHYFDCTATNNLTNTQIEYRNPEGQSINYQINFSQTLKVNTLACDAIDTSIKRTVDHIINVIDEISISEAALKEVNKKITDCDPTDTSKLEALNQLKTQIENKITLQEKMLTDAYTGAMTTCKSAQDKLNVAVADLGARMNRLSSTKSKLEDQEISFTEALSDNEDADLGEAYIHFNEANLLYQATLQATSKTLGNTLLDFI